jgi:hypothetical protein
MLDAERPEVGMVEAQIRPLLDRLDVVDDFGGCYSTLVLAETAERFGP